MAKQSFRDVNTVVLHGTAITGVVAVDLDDEGQEVPFGADANAHLEDIGLTRQVARAEIERMSSSKFRDVLSAVFTALGGSSTGTAIFGRVQRVRLSVIGDEIMDSGDADTWIAFIGLTNKRGEAEITFRDLGQLASVPLVKGKKGTLTVKLPIPRTAFGLPAATATDTFVAQAEFVGSRRRSPHGEINEAVARFVLFGSADPVTETGASGGAKLLPFGLGDEGTVSWVAPAADAGAGEAVSLANAVGVSAEIDIAHGEYARARYRFAAYSSDGVSSPIS